MRKSRLITIVFACSYISAVSALDINDCTSGRTVYIDELYDIEAVVIKRDYSDDTCYVKTNSGDYRWVKASDLMGVVGKLVEDYLEEKALDFIGRCLFGDACTSDSN